MNLVGFKAVNELIGWERGNEFLRYLYQANNQALADNEYQATLGQSSFVLIVHSDDKAREARARCRILQRGLAATLKDHFPGIMVQAEFSACHLDLSESNFDVLLDLARIAYRNSSAAYDIRSDCWLYTEACKEKLREEKRMENRLGEALENHEMELFLQPKVDPATGRVNGAEALVRWRRSDGSVLAPAYFIPVFERNGMIAKVDLFMFREVCLFLNKWIAEGRDPFRISVNVSKYGIVDPSGFANYRKIIEEIKPPMEWIEFELTESMAYNNEEDLSRIIDQIHLMGATCSMDDFGSSYSNLSAIQTLQFDTVKIDRGIFIHGFPDNEKDYQMVGALMRMFASIGINVVAEGIDREDQVKALASMGCHSIQGYYFSRPMDVKDFTEYCDRAAQSQRG
jgi:EAL domain-containing protein (putative c-di-GMP-specific phosphodiesterase class I)